ncbi:MAG TPA: fumarylacetoacetate hydrolase family protein [Bauldia sp.]|nr:fumarylacetoacetate hydrolase family protein [Bauldia sp.]
MPLEMSAAFALPNDSEVATLVGRIWRPDVGGPSVISVRGAELVDISAAAPTMRDLCEVPEPSALARDAKGEPVATLAEVLANTPRERRDLSRPWLLAPVDLQAVKAAGVTFAVSMLERVIEEQARGAPEKAAAIRAEMTAAIGEDLARLKPGSDQAMALKALLIAKGMWSQYLEVGIGPDAEVFTKAPPMAAIGHLAEAGIREDSSWNNPEPEVALVAASSGRIVGATLGNDVNLRDFEGRSALLLGKAKDNNASAALGPFIRLFDRDFSLDDVRSAEVRLTVEGPEGYRLEGASAMNRISRDPAELMAATIGENHRYPDGVVLYLGTMFAPVEDRDTPGKGFTHKVGDVVTIASPKLGRLQNRIVYSADAEPWTFGTAALMRNLAKRGLI